MRAVAVTPESATSVALTKVLLPEAEQAPLDAYDSGEAEAKLLIGDAALRSAFEDPTPHHDLGRLWLERTGLPMVFAVLACPEPLAEGLAELETLPVSSVRLARAKPERLAFEAAERYGYPAGFLARYFEKLRYRFGPRERAGLYTFLELARDAGLLETVPEGSASSRRRPVRRSHERRGTDTGRGDPREGARGRADLGRRGAHLLESRDLVPIGKAADELRTGCTDGGRMTFIIDRNVNYTNVCVTDCDFCAFYRRPGDRAEGYLLPKPVIFKKVEETLAIGGTGVLMQGGHHPVSRRRLLRGSLRLDQGAVPDPPARCRWIRYRALIEAKRSS